MTLKAFITGVAGPLLLEEEKEFLREARPCGLILFDRNISDKDQLKRLIGDYREATRSDSQFILIDQEGGAYSAYARASLEEMACRCPLW